MNNKVYYGEYSLKHWIELILKKNIVLPEYQRLFVWTEPQIKKLIESLKQKQFIPPVIIGAFREENREITNLIIDGQQRLTSIFLAYLGLFPNKQQFKKKLNELEEYRNDLEFEDIEEREENLDNILNWRFDMLTQKGKTKDEIMNNLDLDFYKQVNYSINDDFLESTFLGFSYLVPKGASQDSDHQRYYSTVFRNINYQGVSLSPQESRASLYFLNKTLVSYFKPRFLENIKVRDSQSNLSRIDFVRYLSMLSQYDLTNNVNSVARYFSNKFEDYYADYILSVVDDKDDEKFKKFESIFPNKLFEPRLENLRTLIIGFELPTEYGSIIDLDIVFFGLTYYTLFLNKALDVEQKEDLKTELRTCIDGIKEDSKHTRSPNTLTRIRQRIQESLRIYSNYEC